MNNYPFDIDQTGNYSLCYHQKMFTFRKSSTVRFVNYNLLVRNI